MTLPVPGPISNTTSVGLMAAFATMDVTTAGFLRKCCPRFVLGATKFAPLWVAVADVEVLEDGAEAAL